METSNSNQAVLSSDPPSAWGLLRQRRFGAMWLGTFASSTGSHMHKVTTAWLIYQLTGSETWLGIDAFASALPTVLLLPAGGALADRCDRRSLLIMANALCALVPLGLAVIYSGDYLQVWHILAASAVLGVLQAAIVPATTSLLPTLVGEEATPNAIALNSLQFNLSRVLGPALAGVVLLWGGATWAFALNAISFSVLSTAMATIGPLVSGNGDKQTVARGVIDGLRFVRSRADLTHALSQVAIVALLGAPAVSLLPSLAANQLQHDASGFSLLVAGFGTGAMIAALLSASSRLQFPTFWAKFAPLILGGTLIALGFCNWFWPAWLLVTAAGFCFVGTMIHLGAVILKTSPDEMRGRVSSFQQVCFRISQPLGTTIAGVLATYAGIGVAFWAFGCLLFLLSCRFIFPGAEYPATAPAAELESRS